MGRLNARKTRAILAYCLRHQKGRCINHDGHLKYNRMCRKELAFQEAVMHHLDNNPDNNDPSNCSAACRSCNALLHPRRHGKRGIDIRHKKHSIESESESESERKTNKGNIEEEKRIWSKEFERNIICETKYRAWIIDEIFKYGSISQDDAIDGGAEKVGCSQQTAMRYLRKLCSVVGLLRAYKDANGKGVIRLKPEYRRMTEKSLLDKQAQNWRKD